MPIQLIRWQKNLQIRKYSICEVNHQMYKSRLKWNREEKGMTQSSLSEKSGVSLRLIQAYEQGYKDINSAKCITVLQLAEAMECDIYDIINPRN